MSAIRKVLGRCLGRTSWKASSFNVPPDVQVVVDTEATAKALLARGQLRNRVTIVPLNKARAPPVDLNI